jgi:hypothetical protein
MAPEAVGQDLPRVQMGLTTLARGEPPEFSDLLACDDAERAQAYADAEAVRRAKVLCPDKG